MAANLRKRNPDETASQDGWPSPNPIVLFVSHTGLWGGGAEVVLDQLIEAAKQARLTVELAAPAGDLLRRLGSGCSHVYEVPLGPIRRTTSPGRALKMATNWLRGTGRLGQVMRTSRPSLVHANSGTAALACVGAAALLRIPLIWHQHDIVPFRLVNRLVLVPCGYLSARVIACSQAVADSLVQLGIPSGRVEILHNRARSQFFEPLPDRGTARATLGLPEGDPVVAIIGRIVPYKAHGVFLDAISILLQSGVPLRGLIVGDKPRLEPGDLDPFPGYAQEIWKRAREPDLQGRLSFLGRQEDVRGVFAAIDVLAVPSLGEPFPLVVLEALASAVPVVASASGGHVEAIEDGRTGLLVETGSPAQLASAIGRILTEPELQQRLVGAGRAEAAERFSEAGLAPRLRDIYRSALMGRLERRRALVESP